MESSNTAARQFLDQWCPGGPWVLTAIAVDRKGIATATFTENAGALLDKWLSMFNGHRNIYFHVNPTLKAISKKAEREDIKQVDWLHVDVDPRVGEDLDSERKRALAILQKPPNGVPAPTVIIFSGGGYQGFWKLKKPIPVKGDLVKAEKAKLYNLRLEGIFAADHCHNIDRIMRLPGTVNLPDAGKRRKGRKEELARLIKFNDSLVYPLSKFKKAKEEEVVPSAVVSDTLERLDSVHDLGDSVRDWCKVLIVQGRDPDNPGKYPSRSEALFAVCCELVRSGCDTELIYNVITDPGFGISKSVRDKKSKAKTYALRQIKRAQDDGIDPQLRILNEKHAVIGSGACDIIEEKWDPVLKRTRISDQTFAAFRNRYMPKKVKVGTSDKGEPVYMQLGKWWLLQPQRRQYEQIIFAPNLDVPDCYNLWKGFACEPREGDCSLYWEHAKKNICADDEVSFTYLKGWMARVVQDPGTAGQSSIVLRGRPGTGKGIFTKGFGHLWGRHYMQISNPKHLVGNFNSHLRDCVVLFADEAFYAGDKAHERILKGLITEETLTIEKKYHAAETAPNYTHIIMASNENWVVPAGTDDRRFLVLDVSDVCMQNTEYFCAIEDQLSNGGHEALLYDLLNHDLSNFNVRVIPRTQALQEQKLLSLSSEEEWWYDKLAHGQLLGDLDHTWGDRVRRDSLLSNYLTYSQRVGIARRATATALGKFLRRACPPGWPKNAQGVEVIEDYSTGDTKRYRPYYYQFPPLQVCRDHWDANFGGPYKWIAPESVTQIEGEDADASTSF